MADSSSPRTQKHGHKSQTLFGKFKPERGVLEVKPLDRDLSAFEASLQVLYDLENYGQILLTK